MTNEHFAKKFKQNLRNSQQLFLVEQVIVNILHFDGIYLQSIRESLTCNDTIMQLYLISWRKQRRRCSDEFQKQQKNNRNKK